MALTQRGLVYSIGATQTRQYKDKTFYSRELVIEQPRFDNYTGEKLGSNYVKFEATREDDCRLLDNFHAGDKVEIEFFCRGSLYKKKDGSGEDVFLHLELRGITRVGAATHGVQSGASSLPAAPTPAGLAAPAAPASDYDSELGF